MCLWHKAKLNLKCRKQEQDFFFFNKLRRRTQQKINVDVFSLDKMFEVYCRKQKRGIDRSGKFILFFSSVHIWIFKLLKCNSRFHWAVPMSSTGVTSNRTVVFFWTKKGTPVFHLCGQTCILQYSNDVGFLRSQTSLKLTLIKLPRNGCLCYYDDYITEQVWEDSAYLHVSNVWISIFQITLCGQHTLTLILKMEL